MDDATSLKINEEIVAFDLFMANLQGDNKKHFGAVMCQLAKVNARLELVEKNEREGALQIASLTNALEEEQETRAALEEQLESIEESQNEVNSQLIKERDLAIAKYKNLKKKNAEFEAVHAKLNEDLDRLEEAHKALESEHSSLVESHELLQTRLAEYDVPS